MITDIIVILLLFALAVASYLQRENVKCLEALHRRIKFLEKNIGVDDERP